MADDPAKEPRFEIMGKLHEYLAKTFPLVCVFVLSHLPFADSR